MKKLILSFCLLPFVARAQVVTGRHVVVCFHPESTKKVTIIAKGEWPSRYSGMADLTISQESDNSSTETILQHSNNATLDELSFVDTTVEDHVPGKAKVRMGLSGNVSINWSGRYNTHIISSTLSSFHHPYGVMVNCNAHFAVGRKPAISGGN